MRDLVRILCLALLLTTVEQVQAEFITFNGTASDGGSTTISPGSSYSEGGFNFQFGDGIQDFRDNDSESCFLENPSWLRRRCT